jgi:hypothetical protein
VLRLEIRQTSEAMAAQSACMLSLPAPRRRRAAQALAEFVAAVNEQIALEHRQWLESSASSNAAIRKLEETHKGSGGAKK